MKTILIGIQARSTSTRLPGKCYAVIGNKRSLDHIIDTVNGYVKHVNKYEFKNNYKTLAALLIPEGDEIKNQFATRMQVIEGHPTDVLARYKYAADLAAADYIVRLTGDCPKIPSKIINSIINYAIKGEFDYFGNSDPKLRTSIDGYDCEFISKRLLDYMYENATAAYDREHVTPMAINAKPSWAKAGIGLDLMDLSHVKLSIDTQEDLDHVRNLTQSLYTKLKNAEYKYGRENVFRF